MLLLETFPVGAFQANCTIVADRDTREALVIDPGGDPEHISKIIETNRLLVKAIVLTHAHIDHVLAVRDVKEAHGGEICLHPADRWLYRGVAMQAAMFGMRPRTAESRSVAANGGIAEPTQDGQPSGQPHLRMTSATVCMIGSNCSKQRRASADWPLQSATSPRPL